MRDIRTSMGAMMLGVCLIGAGAGGCSREQGGGNADWKAAVPKDAADSMDAMCRLCRFVDAKHAGSRMNITMRYEGDSLAVDGHGNSTRVTAGEWKGMHEMLARTSENKSAARALQPKARKYSDGLGKVRRNAYLVKSHANGALEFIWVKELDDDSEG